jgi:predicted RNA-binding Zn ribbon-like protein
MSENPFVFRGEALALDLVNTLVKSRGKPTDLLQTPADVALWWESACQHHPQLMPIEADAPIYDEALLQEVKALRDQLRHLFLSVIEGATPPAEAIETLNQALALGHSALVWEDKPQGVYRGVNADASLLLPVAHSALHLLTAMDLSRLHQCHNNRCILLFYDTTKSGTRQWCSTACFDRERAQVRYEQKKQS